MRRKRALKRLRSVRVTSIWVSICWLMGAILSHQVGQIHRAEKAGAELVWGPELQLHYENGYY